MLRPSTSLPPLPDYVSDNYRLAHANDPMLNAIEKMAQSPLKKRLDLSLSASLERVKGPVGDGSELFQSDYVELEVLLASKLRDLENIAPSTPGSLSSSLPSPGSNSSSGSGSNSVVSLPQGERVAKQPRASSRQSSTRSLLAGANPAPQQISAMLQQAREGHALFKASVREISLQLGVHCPERSRLVARTFEYYSLLLQKILPFLETLDRCIVEAADLREKAEKEDKMRKKWTQRVSEYEWGRDLSWEATADATLDYIVKMEKQLDEKQVELKALGVQVSKVESAREELNRQISSLQQDLASSEARYKSEVEAKQGLQKQIESVLEQLDIEKRKLDQQEAKFESEQRERMLDIQKQLATEKSRSSSLEVTNQELSRDLVSQKAINGTNVSAITMCASSLRQCINTLRDHVDTPLPMSVASDDNSANAIHLLTAAMRSGISTISSKIQEEKNNGQSSREHISMLEDHLQVARDEISELSTRLTKAAVSRPIKAIMCDVSVQAVGTAGNGTQERGIQTWGRRDEEDTRRPKPNEEVDSEIPESLKVQDKKSNVEPLSSFLLRYLQKRFGLLEINAEWEVGRLRTSLGRVLDVYVRSLAGPDDD